jgi:two-component system, OmpR family, response regulator
MSVLLIEDDPEVAESIRTTLTARGSIVNVIGDGETALHRISTAKYDVIIADRMLPARSGLEVVQTMRKRGDGTPVLFLTALGGLDDRVEGLEAGADDYLVKPFEHAELIARLEALVRRAKHDVALTHYRVADLELDLFNRTATRANVEIPLQAREFKLLAVLVQHEGRTLTRAMLLERVWGFHFDPRTSVVETHISRLRAKVDRPFSFPLIHTVRGAGYSLYVAPDDPT